MIWQGIGCSPCQGVRLAAGNLFEDRNQAWFSAMIVEIAKGRDYNGCFFVAFDSSDQAPVAFFLFYESVMIPERKISLICRAASAMV